MVSICCTCVCVSGACACMCVLGVFQQLFPTTSPAAKNEAGFTARHGFLETTSIVCVQVHVEFLKRKDAREKLQEKRERSQDIITQKEAPLCHLSPSLSFFFLSFSLSPSLSPPLFLPLRVSFSREGKAGTLWKHTASSPWRLSEPSGLYSPPPKKKKNRKKGKATRQSV